MGNYTGVLTKEMIFAFINDYNQEKMAHHADYEEKICTICGRQYLIREIDEVVDGKNEDCCNECKDSIKHCTRGIDPIDNVTKK